jgi:hypothetical protein
MYATNTYLEVAMKSEITSGVREQKKLDTHNNRPNNEGSLQGREVSRNLPYNPGNVPMPPPLHQTEVREQVHRGKRMPPQNNPIRTTPLCPNLHEPKIHGEHKNREEHIQYSTLPPASPQARRQSFWREYEIREAPQPAMGPVAVATPYKINHLAITILLLVSLLFVVDPYTTIANWPITCSLLAGSVLLLIPNTYR